MKKMTMNERDGIATVLDQDGDKLNVEYKGDRTTVNPGIVPAAWRFGD